MEPHCLQLSSPFSEPSRTVSWYAVFPTIQCVYTVHTIYIWFAAACKMRESDDKCLEYPVALTLIQWNLYIFQYAIFIHSTRWTVTSSLIRIADSGHYYSTTKTSWLFNHRVVTLVADELERQWTGETVVMREYTDNPQNICEEITCLQIWAWKVLTATLTCSCNDSFTDVVRVVSVLRL